MILHKKLSHNPNSQILLYYLVMLLSMLNVIRISNTIATIAQLSDDFHKNVDNVNKNFKRQEDKLTAVARLLEKNKVGGLKAFLTTVAIDILKIAANSILGEALKQIVNNKNGLMQKFQTTALSREFEYKMPKSADPKYKKMRLFFNATVQDFLENVIRTNLHQICTGKGLYNVIAHGPPGTGKTEGFEYVYGVLYTQLAHLRATKQTKKTLTAYKLSGATLSKFESRTALLLLEYIFENARLRYEKYGIVTILFIDEAELMFESRGGTKTAVSDARQQNLTVFLENIGHARPEILVYVTTNRPQDFDVAMTRRIPNNKHIGHPNKAVRVQLIKYLLDESIKAYPSVNVHSDVYCDYITEKNKYVGKPPVLGIPTTFSADQVYFYTNSAAEFIHHLADRMDGFSQSDITNVINKAFLESEVNNTYISRECMDKMVTESIKSKATISKEVSKEKMQDLERVIDNSYGIAERTISMHRFTSWYLHPLLTKQHPAATLYDLIIRLIIAMLHKDIDHCETLKTEIYKLYPIVTNNVIAEFIEKVKLNPKYLMLESLMRNEAFKNLHDDTELYQVLCTFTQKEQEVFGDSSIIHNMTVDVCELPKHTIFDELAPEYSSFNQIITLDTDNESTDDESD